MKSSQTSFPFTLVVIFTISLFSSFAPHLSTSEDDVQLPSFAFGWLDDKDTFAAGDIATIKVKVLGNFEIHKYNHTFNPNITVNDKIGNSSLISGVSSSFGDDFNDWRITYVPIMVGLLNVLITDDNFKVFDSSLHFHVTPGRLYPSAGVVSWMGQVNELVAGAVATVLILPKDAFGNNVSASSEGSNVHNFSLSASFANGLSARVHNVTNKGWNELGYICMEFIAATAGNFFLHVEEGNQTLNGSPLMFKVIPGPLNVSNCVPRWKFQTNSFQLFSVMETYIHQQDGDGNLVPGLFGFDIELIEKGTNLSIPVGDLSFEEVVPGVQLCSFSLMEPGNFVFVIADKEHNNHISHVPYDFTVYIGYCSGVDSLINGSGLNNSVAGEVSRFSISLKDAYQYPAPVELEKLEVQILRENDTDYVRSSISPVDFVNGSQMSGEMNFGTFNGEMNFGTFNLLKTAYAPSPYPNSSSAGSWKVKASEFEVTYKAEKIGIYAIRIFCGNIQLHSGYPVRKEVSAGEVNTSISGVVKFSENVPTLTNNEIVVQLMDSFSNPVLLQQSRLKLEIGSINGSEASTTEFVDNNDGSYTGSYVANTVGAYEICASFDGKRFAPCPFGVNVHSIEYFPKAKNDSVSVWEDESIAFSTLENDYFAGDNASIIEFSKPGHGSLLQYGQLFRYTPHKGFCGNDSFFYAISDENSNTASAFVHISILSIPPQFVYFPSQLQATEDMLTPAFGGFSNFEIIYSDTAENISITLGAQFGTVSLSPMVMQFWQPMWTELSVSKGNENAGNLILEGRLEVINFALRSIRYLGDENFYGYDTMQVSTKNKNGKNEIKVPIFVEPINDPPFVNAPEFIILEEKRNEDEILIFDSQRDKFNFSVGDPDLLFLGNDSQFLVMFSVEVSSGLISTNLPADLISTTELKLRSSYQWQPLQTFVTISKHFMVKAKGIRFRGTVNECNSVMQHLSYHGGQHGARLTVSINDMGKYGCFPDCSKMMSKPLFAEATINLIRRRPMSSLAAHALGSAIAFEFVVVFALGMILTLFMCKCAFVLVRERNERQKDHVRCIELSNVQCPEKTLCAKFSENTSQFTSCCPRPFSITSQPTVFCQRSGLKSGNISEGSHSLSQSSGDHGGTMPGSLSIASGKRRKERT